MKTEIWKDIKKYEGLYKVSNLGRIKRLEKFVELSNNRTYHVTEKILSLKQKENTYIIVRLVKNKKHKSYYVHRLVAKAFLIKQNNKNEINHKDGNKSNNHINNLEWATRKENIQHAIKTKLNTNSVPNNKRSISILQFSLSGKLVKVWPSMREIQRALPVSQANVWAVCNYRRNTLNGFIWRYGHANSGN